MATKIRNYSEEKFDSNAGHWHEPTSPSVFSGASPIQAQGIAYNAIMDLRMYMSVATIKNPLLMIDEYMESRGIHGR